MSLRIRRVGVQFQVPIQIVTSTFRCISDANGDGNDGISTRLHRFLFQLHPSLFRCAPAFPIITSPTGRHDIFPGFFSAFGDGNDMIERQFFRSKFMVTILTTVPVSRKDIDAGELDGPMAVLQSHQFQ